YPALVDDGDSVSIRVFTKLAIQRRIMPGGVRRLIVLAVPVARRPLERMLGNREHLALARLGIASVEQLLDDCVDAAADALMTDPGAPPWPEAGFESLRDVAHRQLAPVTAEAVRQAAAIVVAADGVRARLDQLIAPALRPSVDDARAHVRRLLPARFVVSS